LIFERFLTHKLTLSSTGLFSHPFRIYIFECVRRDHALGRSVSILSRKWIFDNLVDPFSTFLLFTSGIRTTCPVHGAPIHTWSKFDLFWKTSTSPSLASSINQSIKSQTSSWLQKNNKATQLIAIEGMVFFILFVSGNENVNHHSPNCPTYCPT
jgi:hypothetical protein